MDRALDRVVDLLDPSLNRIHNMTVDEARRRILSADSEAVRAIDGSFALLERDGVAVRMARSLDRPLRFFTPFRAVLPADVEAIGRLYVGALADEVAKWLRAVDADSPTAPIGVCFSGGIDSGSVFLVTYHVMRRLGMSPSRLKAPLPESTLRARRANQAEAMASAPSRPRKAQRHLSRRPPRTRRKARKATTTSPAAVTSGAARLIS